MNIEEKIAACEIVSKQIKQYDPDPFYVDYFFNQYVGLRDDVITGIFEEADRDFGLFLSKQATEENFGEKARLKNDVNAVKFSEWFTAKYSEEHENPYPNFINNVSGFREKFNALPEIKIMLRATGRYKDDINQLIEIGLNQNKLRSKEELKIQIKRQSPVFLEIINHKRRERNEPRVRENQVTASAFSDNGNGKDVEIVYAAEIYIPVMKRLIEESREKITELTR